MLSQSSCPGTAGGPRAGTWEGSELHGISCMDADLPKVLQPGAARAMLHAALEELGIKDPGPDMVETRRSGEARRVSDTARENPPRPPPSPLLPLCMRVFHSAPRLSLLSLLASTETDLHGERACGCTERWTWVGDTHLCMDKSGMSCLSLDRAVHARRAAGRACAEAQPPARRRSRRRALRPVAAHRCACVRLPARDGRHVPDGAASVAGNGRDAAVRAAPHLVARLARPPRGRAAHA